MKPVIIHFAQSSAKHIKDGALRSSLQLLVTCKRCQRKHWPSVAQERKS